MKALMTIIITIGVILLGVIAVLAVSHPVQASGNHSLPPVDQPPPTTSVPVHKKNDNRWQVPVLVIVVGAGVWCWFECSERKQAETYKEREPLKVTPDNLPLDQ